MTYNVQWTCSQNVICLALPVWDCHYLEYVWTKGSLSQLNNQSMDGGDFRTAPATPGLLKKDMGKTEETELPHGGQDTK